MPFTFAHPAAVLPLKYLPKKWTSLTGLVFGSMAPDFEKFLSMEGGNSYSHTWGAIFWFCLPLGIILSFLYHLIVRDPLIDNLPSFLRKRLACYKKLDWKVYFRKYYFVVIISIIVGAATHLIWDGFTHKNGPGETQLALLGEYTSLNILSVPLFYFLNLLSSAIGVVIVLFAILRLPAKAVVVENTYKSKAYWPAVTGILLIIVFIRFSSGLNFQEVLRVERDFFNLIVVMVAASLVSILITSSLLRLIFFNKG